MMHRVLAAIDDSGPALAAADLAVEMTKSWNASLRFVAVAEDGLDPGALLDHLLERAAEHGITATATVVPSAGSTRSAPFEAILALAREWNADLLVMGQSDKRHTGGPYVGSQTEHVLEFSTIPVLVVPDTTQSAPFHDMRSIG